MQRAKETSTIFQEATLMQLSKNSGSTQDAKKRYKNIKNDSIALKDRQNLQNINAAIDPKWQITLMSENCTIKKHSQGWQICPRTMNDAKEDTLLTPNDLESKKNVNVATWCNRDNIEELLEDEVKENDLDHGSILMKEYLKLITSETAKVNFILTVLTKAIDEHKVFVISGLFPAIRRPLMKRGWIEKRAIRKMIALISESNDGLEQIEKLLRNAADFIWYTNKKAATIRTDDKTIVNKFVGCYFTSKIDMCNNLENVYWYYEAGVSNIQFPRCYNIYQTTQVDEFIRDFYVTACTGLLKWFLFVTSIAGANAAWSPSGTVPVTAILFALERCVECISVHAHEDIDRKDYKEAPATAWNQFLDWYEQIMTKRAMMKENNKVDINELLTFAENILRELCSYRPQSRVDGMRNIWILKPGDKSLGRGIVLKSSLNEILHKVNQAAKEGMQYVVQKYIERPLLVHKTKIDVRQWFLITSTQPLVVWMYKDILIRFASRDFTLNDFHESIHLCNTTVQLKYRKLPEMNLQLPNELHWNLQHFKEYLKSKNNEGMWEKNIRPGIKQNLIGALLASQDNMVNRKNSFQLYGADFVIMDDFSVWLIEINTNPRLHPPSSAVTAKLYPEVIEDTVKVVLDRRKNRKAPHGKFECIFKQRNTCCGINVLGQGTSLGIRGRALIINPPRSPRNKT